MINDAVVAAPCRRVSLGEEEAATERRDYSSNFRIFVFKDFGFGVRHAKDYSLFVVR
jgi:hypothetical protein